MNLNGQLLDIRISDRTINTILIDQMAVRNLVDSLNGYIDSSLFKDWTKQSYSLNDSSILIELYDGSGVHIKNLEDYHAIDQIRFLKNYMDYFKNNISYRYNISESKADELEEFSTKLNFKSERPELYNYKVYQTEDQSILFDIVSEQNRKCVIYPNIKTLASDDRIIPNEGNSEILHQWLTSLGGDEIDDFWAKTLVSGDDMSDFDPRNFFIWSYQIEDLISNHHLSLIEKGIKVEFFDTSDLYKSTKGYYITITSSLHGSTESIHSTTIFDSIEEVREIQNRLANSLRKENKSEHFYGYISTEFGTEFPNSVDSLINDLPDKLNFNKKNLTFDLPGMEIVNEAIRWNHDKRTEFNNWYPCVLAYYGKCYSLNKQEVRWITKIDQEYDVIIPYLINETGTEIFDPYEFYKVLFEWPSSIQWAGDWRGFKRRMKSRRKIR